MTELSRRAVLRAGVLAAAALPFSPIATAEASSSSTALYTRSRFAPYLNSTFTLTAGTASWKAVLAQIGDLPNAAPGDENCFSLAFRLTSAGPGQRTCSLRRSGFTATPLFVVPTGQSTSVYEAVINRVT